MLFQKLKTDKLTAFKERDHLRNSLLGTLIGEASKQAKVPSDEEVTATIKQFIKNANVVIKNLEKTPEDARLEQAHAEIKILQNYLPSQITGEGLKKVIDYVINLEGVPRNIKSMKQVMKALNAQYPDRFNGEEAALMVREALAGE